MEITGPNCRATDSGMVQRRDAESGGPNAAHSSRPSGTLNTRPLSERLYTIKRTPPSGFTPAPRYGSGLAFSVRDVTGPYFSSDLSNISRTASINLEFAFHVAPGPVPARSDG